MKVKEEEIVLLMSRRETQEKGMKMIMDTYQSRLYWYIRRIITDEDLAKDILQEVFIKAYQNFSQFKKESKLYTWLYRIASNEALQQLNKQNKMPKVKDAEEYLAGQMASENINKSEVQRLLTEAIQSLPEKQKMVFSLRYYEEMPYEEMSKVLDMSVGTLKTNYHYAREKVEQYILERKEDF